MQNNSTLISSIHNARETLVQLMSKQGYDISEYENTSLTETNAKHSNEQLDMLFDKPMNKDSTIHKTYINFYLGKSLRPAYIQEIVDDLFNIEDVLTKQDTLIMIVKEDPHDTIINTIKHIWEKDGIFIIIHNIKRLQFNILNHTLVPPHRIISNAESEDLKKTYRMKSLNDLPEISRFDPVALAIGMKPEQICEIIRPSKTSVTSKYYRICK